MKRDFKERETPVHFPNIERYNKPVIIFLTVCTNKRKQILANQEMHKLLAECWRESEQWRVGNYIIMPDHIHLFCSPVCPESENVNKWVTFWKRAVSRQKPDMHPIWQRDCWDTQLRQGDKYSEKWNYVELNPVRKGLVESPDEWPYKGTLNELRW